MSLKRKAADLAKDATKKPKANGSITAFFGTPKSNLSTSSPNPSQPASSPTASVTEPVKFDKEAWMAKLKPEQKELLKLEIETLHESWLAALKTTGVQMDDPVTKYLPQLRKLEEQQDVLGQDGGFETPCKRTVPQIAGHFQTCLSGQDLRVQ